MLSSMISEVTKLLVSVVSLLQDIYRVSHVLDRFLTFCPYHLVHPNSNIFLYANIIFTLTHLFLFASHFSYFSTQRDAPKIQVSNYSRQGQHFRKKYRMLLYRYMIRPLQILLCIQYKKDKPSDSKSERSKKKQNFKTYKSLLMTRKGDLADIRVISILSLHN